MRTNFLIVLTVFLLFACNSKVEENTNSYDGVKAFVVAKTNMVLVDNYLEAELYFNRKITDSIKVDFGNDFTDGSEISVQSEKIVIKKKCTDIGLHKLEGKISFIRNNEKLAETDISYEYIVTPPVFNVFNRNLCYVMNVNVDNQIEVSVQGVIPSDISLTCNNGKILKNNGGYIVIPEKKGECEVSVMVKQNDEMKKIGERIFEVK